MKSKTHEYPIKNIYSMSKKTLILSLLAVVLYACGNKENAQNVDELIAAKNVTALQAKKQLYREKLLKLKKRWRL